MRATIRFGASLAIMALPLACGLATSGLEATGDSNGDGASGVDLGDVGLPPSTSGGASEAGGASSGGSGGGSSGTSSSSGSGAGSSGGASSGGSTGSGGSTSSSSSGSGSSGSSSSSGSGTGSSGGASSGADGSAMSDATDDVSPPEGDDDGASPPDEAGPDAGDGATDASDASMTDAPEGGTDASLSDATPDGWTQEGGLPCLGIPTSCGSPGHCVDCIGSAQGSQCVQGACGCSSAFDCPSGHACQNHQCTLSCPGFLQCNGGCCDGTRCLSGGDPGACGQAGGQCVSCSGGTPTCAGGACVSTCGGNANGTCGTGYCCTAGNCTPANGHNCGPGMMRAPTAG